MEQKIKTLLGDLMFMIASLQFQVETLQKENEGLKNKVNDLEKSAASPPVEAARFARRHD